MKALKCLLTVLIAVFALTSCKDCKNENPRAMVTNNGTKEASVQIKTSGGNTENINNVLPGTASDFKAYAPGEVTFTISVEKVPYVHVVNMAECYEYNIVIDTNNVITTIPTDRND